MSQVEEFAEEASGLKSDLETSVGQLQGVKDNTLQVQEQLGSLSERLGEALGRLEYVGIDAETYSRFQAAQGKVEEAIRATGQLADLITDEMITQVESASGTVGELIELLQAITG